MQYLSLCMSEDSQSCLKTRPSYKETRWGWKFWVSPAKVGKLASHVEGSTDNLFGMRQESFALCSSANSQWFLTRMLFSERDPERELLRIHDFFPELVLKTCDRAVSKCIKGNHTVKSHTTLENTPVLVVHCKGSSTCRNCSKCLSWKMLFNKYIFLLM